MSTQTVTTENTLAEQAVQTNDGSNSLIMALGEHLGRLSEEFYRVDDVGYRKKNKWSDHLWAVDKSMHETCILLSGYQAHTLPEVAIQLRALASMNFAQTEECDEAGHRLCKSILNYVEANGGGTRKQWAGEYFIGKMEDTLDDKAA